MSAKVILLHDPRKRKPYVVRWYGEYDPANGSQRRYGKSFALKKDAERFKTAKQAEFNKGAQRDRPVDISLGEFCEKYMQRRRHEWAEKTRLGVEDVCNRLLAYFGPKRSLSTITSDRAAAFWSEARKVDPRCRGAELSKSSRNCILRYARTMFRYAVTWGDLITNPFAELKLIRVGRKNRRKWHYITPAEYYRLLRAAPLLRWKVFYALAYTSGARLGELLNLTQADVNLAKGVLRIADRPGTTDVPPFHLKDHEERSVPLPRHTVKLLRGWLQKRDTRSPLLLLTPERFARVRQRWIDCQRDEKPWLNDYMTNNIIRDIRRHARWAGIELDGALTLHCFRKSCGQNWAQHLPMNVVKELMGHADISTTAEFYTVVGEEHEAKAQWVTEAMILDAAREKKDARWTPRLQINPDRKVG